MSSTLMHILSDMLSTSLQFMNYVTNISSLCLHESPESSQNDLCREHTPITITLGLRETEQGGRAAAHLHIHHRSLPEHKQESRL